VHSIKKGKINFLLNYKLKKYKKLASLETFQNRKHNCD